MNALVFLVVRSFKNALVKRLRRLRDVRYLVSTIVFLGYMVLVFGSWFLASLSGSSKPEPASPTMRVFGLAAILGLMVASFSSTWLWPERNQLIFSPAEIQFLFPAPLRRETLLRLKMVKAQLPLLFTAVFAAFASRRGESLHWWAVLAGTWLAFNAAFLHRLGAALTLVPSGSPWRHRVPLVLGRVAVATLLVSLVVSFRAFDPSATPSALAEGLVAWSQRAPASWAILPFRILLRPALAPDLASFLAALRARSRSFSASTSGSSAPTRRSRRRRSRRARSSTGGSRASAARGASGATSSSPGRRRSSSAGAGGRSWRSSGRTSRSTRGCPRGACSCSPSASRARSPRSRSGERRRSTASSEPRARSAARSPPCSRSSRRS